MERRFLLYTIVLLEGYVILSTELLAIRQSIPFVGNGVEVIAVIISGVLLPLSFGYYRGGQLIKTSDHLESHIIKNVLTKNFLKAAVILSFGLSYLFLTKVFYHILYKGGVNNHLIQISLFSILFLAYPIYLIGQTVPLISNYFSSSFIPKVTGRLLFFSTLGSFLGSIFTTIVLMETIGVNHTVMITIGFLLLMGILLNKKENYKYNLCAFFILVGAFLLNSNSSLRSLSVIRNNAYSTIAIKDFKDADDTRMLSINRSQSSLYSKNPDKIWSVIKYIESNFINKMRNERSSLPKEILVLGAGGFILGLHDQFNLYTYVDIDNQIKEVAEKYFLKQALSTNKKFVPLGARVFLNRDQKKYDLIIVDAYSNRRTVPPQLLTLEFYNNIKYHLKEDGVAVFNILASPNFKDKFSIIIDNTLRKVFYPLTRQVLHIQNRYYDEQAVSGIVYSFFNNSTLELSPEHIYSDNKNTYFYDRRIEGYTNPYYYP